MRKQIVYITTTLLLIGSLSLLIFAHDAVLPLLEDINQDGIVNIEDLVLVAAAFGHTEDNQNADVNRDGITNILDLILVSNAFGETATADNSTYHEIQDYIFDKSCVNAACHAVPATAGGLDLSYELSYQNLVGQTPQNPADAAAGMKLVDPGTPDNSFILTKLTGPTAP